MVGLGAKKARGEQKNISEKRNYPPGKPGALNPAGLTCGSLGFSLNQRHPFEKKIKKAASIDAA